MKFIVLFFFLSFLASKTYAQIDSERMVYAAKMEKYRRMRHTGATLTVTGGILVIVGVVTLINSSVDTYSNGSTTKTTTTGNPVAGAAAYLLGVAGLGSGIPLWIVGGHQYKKYERKLLDVHVGFNLNRNETGLKLTCRF